MVLKQRLSTAETRATLFEGRLDDMKRHIIKLKIEKDTLSETTKNYERQIDKLVRYEGNAKSLAEETNIKIDNALLERDKIKAKCKFLQDEINRLQNEREVRLKKSLEECTAMVAISKQKYADDINAKITEANDMLMENTKLKSKNECRLKENDQALKKIKKLETLLEEERGNIRDQYDDINSRLKEAEAKCIAEQIQREELEQQLQAGKCFVAKMDNLKRIAETSLNEKQTDFEEKYSALTSNFSQVNLEMVNCKHEIDRLKNMLSETVLTYENKVKILELEKNSAVSEACMNSINARQIAEEREISLEQQSKTYKQSLDQSKNSSNEVLRHLEKKLQEERERSQVRCQFIWKYMF